jgi:hypothetical protein
MLTAGNYNSWSASSIRASHLPICDFPVSDLWGDYSGAPRGGRDHDSGQSRGKSDRKRAGIGPGKTTKPNKGFGLSLFRKGPTRGYTRDGGSKKGPGGWFGRGPKK